MKTELLNKFTSVIDYSSGYEEKKEKGLKKVNCGISLDIDLNGRIAMSIQISLTDFYSDKKEITPRYKHQTVFQLSKGQQLNKMEFVEMFRYTENQFLHTEVTFDDNKSEKIKEIFGLK
ncbi:MAG: hypothetical protein Q8K02_01945, partial [Flavobacterium sp.]|nr:hypothetical protein [Flavobacterium sp.]